jgi:hypothetical protein
VPAGWSVGEGEGEGVQKRGGLGAAHTHKYGGKLRPARAGQGALQASHLGFFRRPFRQRCGEQVLQALRGPLADVRLAYVIGAHRLRPQAPKPEPFLFRDAKDILQTRCSPGSAPRGVANIVLACCCTRLQECCCACSPRRPAVGARARPALYVPQRSLVEITSAAAQASRSRRHQAAQSRPRKGHGDSGRARVTRRS